MGRFKQILVFSIFLLFAQKGFAHKDRIYFEESGTVKAYMIASFDYAESLKLKMLAKFSNEIAKSLGEKDTILIKYDHRGIDNNKEYLLDYTKTDFLLKHEQRAICVYFRNRNISIPELLNLVEFAIKNKKSLNKYQVIVDDYNFETREKEGSHKATNLSFIESIYWQEKSDLIKSLMEMKILVFKEGPFEIEWSNKEYIIYSNVGSNRSILFTIQDNKFYSFQLISEGIVFFIDERNFHFVNDKGEVFNRHELDSQGQVYFFEKRANGIYMVYRYSSIESHVFLALRDKLLKEIN